MELTIILSLNALAYLLYLTNFKIIRRTVIFLANWRLLGLVNLAIIFGTVYFSPLVPIDPEWTITIIPEKYLEASYIITAIIYTSMIIGMKYRAVQKFEQYASMGAISHEMNNQYSRGEVSWKNKAMNNPRGKKFKKYQKK